VDVAQRPIKDQYYRRPNEWEPHRLTVAYVRDAQIGLTLFELTENMRVRRMGANRYVRISDLRRRAVMHHNQRVKWTRQEICRPDDSSSESYSPRHDAAWQHD
jgi:hypothetical protein